MPHEADGSRRPQGAPEDAVPLFGSWRAIYAAVIATAVVVMLLLAFFSRWPW